MLKLDSTCSSFVYASYLGGSGNDKAHGITVDIWDRAYLVGETTSTDFPTEVALQSTSGGGQDGFVAALTVSGTQLRYSTYFGGSGTDSARGIATDANRNAYLTGATDSADLPLASPFQGGIAGGTDAFVARVASAILAHHDSYYVDHDKALQIPAEADSGSVLLNDEEPNLLPLTAVVDSQPTSGTLSLGSEGWLIYTPNPGFQGIDSFDYHASNGSESSNQATVTIKVGNSAPVGKQDRFILLPGNSLTVPGTDLVGNDSDRQGDNLTASRVTGSGPNFGTLDYFDADGSFRYTPNPGFSGTDFFRYALFDGLTASAPILVTLVVQEEPAVNFVNVSRGGDTVVVANITAQGLPGGTKDLRVQVTGPTAARLQIFRRMGAISGGAVFVDPVTGIDTTVLNVPGNQTTTVTIHGRDPSSQERGMFLRASIGGVNAGDWDFTVFYVTAQAFATGSFDSVVPNSVTNDTHGIVAGGEVTDGRLRTHYRTQGRASQLGYQYERNQRIVAGIVVWLLPLNLQRNTVTSDGNAQILCTCIRPQKTLAFQPHAPARSGCGVRDICCGFCRMSHTRSNRPEWHV